MASLARPGQAETERRPKAVPWREFAAAAPAIAAQGRDLFYRTGHGEALLVTVRGDNPPRVHPISIDIVNGGLYAFILPSPKLQDLEQDGRYALHAHFDASAPHEFLLRGRVQPVNDETCAALATIWDWTVGNAPAFEFLVEDAILGERASADDWPPSYTTWTSQRTSSE